MIGKATAHSAARRSPTRCGPASDAISIDLGVQLRLLVIDSSGTASTSVESHSARQPGAGGIGKQPPPASVAGGGAVTLDGTAIDPEGDTLTYAWTSAGGGSFADASALDTTWTAPDATDAAQTIMLTLMATDDRRGNTLRLPIR